MNVIYLKDGNGMEVVNYFDDLCKEYGANFDEEIVTPENIFEESSSKNNFNIEEFMRTDPIYSMRQAKKLKQAENLKSLKNWYNLPRQEITDDVKVFATRHAWDTKRFYKGDDRSKQTEYFQRGAIENSAFTPSAAVNRQNKNADILDNLLESETLKKKLGKIEQVRRHEHSQKQMAKRNLERRKNRKSEKIASTQPRTKKGKLQTKRQKA